MNTIKELALIEPLVDGVYSNTICTDEVPILNVDIMTVKKEDLDFKSNFTLNVKRNDYIHAFVVYFDCEFSFGTKKFTLSTCIILFKYLLIAPHRNTTHWKQTVFYTKTPLIVCQGDSVNGSISTNRNDKNPRDLDIKIDFTFKNKYMTNNENNFYRLR